MIYGFILGLAVIAGSIFQMFWWGVGVGVLIDFILLLSTRYGKTIKGWIPKRSHASAGTAHVAPAGGHAPTKTGWVGKIIFILLLAGFGYLYLTDRIGYSKTIDVSIADLSDKKVCGLQANTRLVFRPVNPVVVQYGRPNEGFLPIDITSTMRVREAGNPNDTLPGEAFITDSQGCVVVTLDIRESFRKEAVLDRVDQVMAKHPRGVQLRFESAWRPSW